MAREPWYWTAISVLSLTATWKLLRTRTSHLMVALIAIAYGLIAMVVGGMLTIGNEGISGTYSFISFSGPLPWYNYPAYQVIFPNGALSLPFLATISMVIVAIGVGVGMTVAVRLTARLIAARHKANGGPVGISALAGLTPAMLALATLGACCSTTAAALAGVGVVAQSSGTSITSLAINTWYLNVFQIVVLWIALIAQEELLETYGPLVGLTSVAAGSPGATTDARSAAAPRRWRGARFWTGGALRVALLLGGATWGLASIAEWTSLGPGLSLGPALLFQVIVEHGLIGAFAVLIALFPAGMLRGLSTIAHRADGWSLRGALFVGGIVLVTWVPAALASAGVETFGNELLGGLGAPASWGAVVPFTAPGVALFLRWGLQMLVLGGFAIAWALAPERALEPIRWTLSGPTANAPGSASQEGREPPARRPAGAAREAPGAAGSRPFSGTEHRAEATGTR